MMQDPRHLLFYFSLGRDGVPTSVNISPRSMDLVILYIIDKRKSPDFGNSRFNNFVFLKHNKVVFSPVTVRWVGGKNPVLQTPVGFSPLSPGKYKTHCGMSSVSKFPSYSRVNWTFGGILRPPSPPLPSSTRLLDIVQLSSVTRL